MTKNRFNISSKIGLLITTITTLLLVSFYFVAEVGLRMVFGKPVIDNRVIFEEYIKYGKIAEFTEMYHWQLIPNSVAVSIGNNRYKINAQGYRGPDFELKRSKLVYRIVFAGDSNFFGWEVPEEACVPALIRDAFEKEPPGKKIEVINAGVPGRTTYQGLRELQETWLQLDPQMIVWGFGWNDGLVSKDRLSDKEFHDISRTYSYRFKRWLRKSAVISFLDNLLEQKQQHKTERIEPEREYRNGVAYADSPEETQNDKTRVFKAESIQTNKNQSGTPGEAKEQTNLQRAPASNLAQPTSASALPKKQPLPYRVSPADYRFNLLKTISICREHSITLVFLPIGVKPEYLDIMKDVAVKTNTPLIDAEDYLFRVFTYARKEQGLPPPPAERVAWIAEAQKILFSDNCHPTAAGYTIIATAAYPILADLVRKDLKSRGINPPPRVQQQLQGTLKNEGE